MHRLAVSRGVPSTYWGAILVMFREKLADEVVNMYHESNRSMSTTDANRIYYKYKDVFNELITGHFGRNPMVQEGSGDDSLIHASYSDYREISRQIEVFHQAAIEIVEDWVGRVFVTAAGARFINPLADI